MGRARVKGTARVIRTMERNPGRGGVYWWMWDEHDTILARTQGRPIAWSPVLAEIQRLGLKNGDGQPVTNTGSLRSTWSRVRRDKRREAEEKQRQAAGQRKLTSDPPPVVSRTVVPVVPVAPPEVPVQRTRTAQEQAEWIQAEIAQRSGKGPPFEIKLRPRHVIEEEARLAAERRPDLFPRGPDITRYQILKESGKRL